MASFPPKNIVINNFKHLIIPLKLLQVSLLFLDKNAALKPVNVTLHIGLHAQAGRSGMQSRYNHIEQDPDIT